MPMTLYKGADINEQQVQQNMKIFSVSI